jgi:threonyl-tRNA synthetase
VCVISVRENHAEYAGKIAAMLKDAGIRAELDDSNENLGKKVRESKMLKIPYTIVIGDKEMESGKLALERREKGKLTEMTPEEVVKTLLDEIKKKA